MISIDNINSGVSLADWIELYILAEFKPLSKSSVITLLSGNEINEIVDNLDGEFVEDEHNSDEALANEALFDSALTELERRLNLYGNKPPFSIARNRIIPNVYWKDCPEHYMCLLFAYWGAWSAHCGTKLFERLSNAVLASYLQGKAMTLGFPNPETLSDQIQSIAKELCEEVGGRKPLSSDKDRGVDVIGWKSFNDSRNGQIVVLMQCAAGRTWESKKSIPLPSWSQFIHWNFTTTIQSLSITEIVKQGRWQNRIDDYGIIFDRARIYQSLYNNNYEIDLGLRTEITDWCQEKLAS